jgi:hypothetical protein
MLAIVPAANIGNRNTKNIIEEDRIEIYRIEEK